MFVAKMVLISCTATAKLICIFIFGYAKSRFSHNEALTNVTLLSYF